MASNKDFVETIFNINVIDYISLLVVHWFFLVFASSIYIILLSFFDIIDEFSHIVFIPCQRLPVIVNTVSLSFLFIVVDSYFYG